MSNEVNQFVITKGSDNNFVFTIKENGTTLPMTIDATDTFAFKLVKLSDGSEATTTTSAITKETPLTSGKIKLTVTIADTTALVSDKSDAVDRYYNRPTYKLIIECSTLVNGDFIAKVAEVYVD